MDPGQALRRIAYLLERSGAEGFRATAFRKAAAAIDAMAPGELAAIAAEGKLRTIPGLGETTARIVAEALAGGVPAYLARLEAEYKDAFALPEASTPAEALRALLRGDCHAHSEWSDGGAPIAEMARTARDLGHDYLVLTDHSPRLKVANGLSAARLREQLQVVAALNVELAPFHILTGIEVDILDEGELDQEPELLARLDLVVGSVHSKLRMEREPMTHRLVNALANPHLDILGHCTGQMYTKNKARPPSEFDPDYVFHAAVMFNKAIEINARPERLDPPAALLAQARDAGCIFSIDSDAHAPGQLAWQMNGCIKAVDAGIEAERIVNTWTIDRLLEWTASHDQ